MQSRSIPDPCLKVLESEVARAKQENRLEDLLKVLEERAHTRGSAMDWVELGYYHNKLRKSEAAVECCDKALEIDPRDAAAWNNKGSALNNLSRYEAAVECCDKALEIDSRDEYAWKNKGHALRKLGRHEAARECYERALELDSKDPRWVFYRCESIFALRRWEAGFAALREAFERLPRDTRHDVKSLIDLILRLSDGPEELRRHLATLIAIYHEVGVLAYLGDGLVRSLRQIDAWQFSVKTLEAWRDSWLELGDGHAELVIPLRIFRVGIEYLIRGEEKVLLDLVAVERTILRQAFGLDARDGAE